MNVLALNNRVRFTLKSSTFDSINIVEPLEWSTDEKEFTRNEDYHGIFINMSNNLTFVGNAADYIDLVYQTEGILADLRLTREERHPVTDNWTLSYSGFLDMTTYQKENDRIKMKFNSGGIEAVLKARENEMIEIDRLDTIDGEILSDLATVDVKLDGRHIFLETAWKAAPMNYYKELFVESRDGNRRTKSNTFPFEIFKNSHEQAQDTNIGSDGYLDQANQYFLLLNNMDRTRNITIHVKDLSFYAYSFETGGINNGNVSVALVKYKFNGSEYIVVNNSEFTLWTRNLDNNRIPSGLYGVNDMIIPITLNLGESLGLRVSLDVDFARSYPHTDKRDFFYKLNSGQILIRENSSFEQSYIKAVKPYYLANRLIEIITNRKDIVLSNILQNGQWKDLLLAHGLWIRSFSREQDLVLPEDERKFKPLTTSFKDFITSFSAVANLGVGIEKNGYDEKIVIEELGYFYNQNVTIKLPNQVKNIKRSIDSNKYFKNIEIGFEKGGEYEEAMGLDEFNVKNTYTSCISNVKNQYNQVSKYRADTYGIEFARRKPFGSYSTEDTSYDQDIFFLDCKLSINGYLTRKYNDDFTNIPEGVFSPETAFNLRLSPFNSLLRHGWVIGAGLTKYLNQKVKYASSTGNSSLKTEYFENGEIQNTRLQKAKYVPEIIEFNHKVDFEISQILSGKTRTIDNQVIPNVYGLVEFTNELGQTERGYLLSVKPNGEGKWRLLKSNR